MFLTQEKIKFLYLKIIIIVFLFSLYSHISLAQSIMPVADDVVRDNTSNIKIDTAGIKIDTAAIRENTTGIRDSIENMRVYLQDISSTTRALLVTTDEIAHILTGDLPGEQYDNIQARQTLVEVRLLLRQMANSIANFAQSGFDGNPAFVANTGQYFQNIEDQTINVFLTSTTSLNTVCPNLQTAVKQAVGDNYDSFQNKIACTITNPDQLNSANNFSQNGSWTTFLKQTTEPQNNLMGATLMAQIELDRQIENRVASAKMEAEWGSGFKSWKDCSDAANADYSRNYDGCVIKTPGSVILNKISAADTASMRELEMADNFNTLTYIASQSVSGAGGAYTSLGSISSAGGNGGGLLRGNYSSVVGNSNTIYNRYRNYLYALNPSYYNNNPNNPNNNPNPNNPAPVVNLATAITMLNYKIDTETNYLGSQNNVLNLLLATRQAFASSTASTTCTAVTVNGIIAEIDGTASGTISLTWNKLNVTSAVNTTMNNLSILNNAKTALSATGLTDPQIVQIYQNATVSSSLHTEADVVAFSTGTSFINIKNWIQNLVNIYKTPCTLNTSLFSTWGIQ
jgi:hypothetical protein